LTASRKQNETLDRELAKLKLEVQSAKQVITQTTETKEKLLNDYVTATFQNRKYETEIKDLRDKQETLENTLVDLKFRIQDLKEREKAHHEAEDQYERNFQDIANKTFETTKFLDELQNYTAKILLINLYIQNLKPKKQIQ
jgi:predicted  nucleic acid-binding Zn-ribbon protein